MAGEHCLELVDSFHYLGDAICAGGGCEAPICIRVRAAWGKFVEYFSFTLMQIMSLRTWGRVYGSCVRGVMLYNSKC